MSDPFLAEIRIFPYSFAPRFWAFCNGQILPISQNAALYALLGGIYGGDGRSNFGLPNLQGRAPMFYGQGTGLSNRVPGQTGGSTSITLQPPQMPAHTHTMRAHTADVAEVQKPSPATALAPNPSPGMAYQSNTNQTLVQLSGQALPSMGGGQGHNNMQPYGTLNFCIALQGTFPIRS